MLHIRTMTNADIPLGDRLRREAGWNQTEDDWRRFLQLEPEGCFVAEWNSQPAGTTVACTFGSVAWVAMVLVDRSLCGQGIGTRLMEHALDWLDRRGVPSVRLDATPLGQPIYRKLGFIEEYELVRMEGMAERGGLSTVQNTLTPALSRKREREELEDLCRIDQQVTATARGRLLEAFLCQQPKSVCVDARAYVMFRPGVNALQIGPAGALEPAAGQTLADWALGQCAGRRVFIDIPSVNHSAMAWAGSRGLVAQRRLVRMCRGPRVADRPAWIWASSGPELG